MANGELQCFGLKKPILFGTSVRHELKVFHQEYAERLSASGETVSRRKYGNPILWEVACTAMLKTPRTPAAVLYKHFFRDGIPDEVIALSVTAVCSFCYLLYMSLYDADSMSTLALTNTGRVCSHPIQYWCQGGVGRIQE